MTIFGVRPRLCAVGVVALLAVVAMPGCADDNPSTPTQPTSTTYQGGYADNGNGRGGLDFTFTAALTVQAAEQVLGGSAVAATGEIRPSGGAAVAMSGTYDPAAFTITLAQVTRGGGTFSLTGLLQNGAFRGTILTPTGTGAFAAIPVSVVEPETVYCGAYNWEGGGGYFDSIVFGTSVIVGSTSFSDSITRPLLGTVAGNIITIDDQGVVAEGTINGGSVTGTYSVPANQENGTWSGSTDACTSGLRR